MFGGTALCFVLENGVSKIAVSLIVSCFAYRRISIMSDLLNNLCAFILDSIFGKKHYTMCLHANAMSVFKSYVIYLICLYLKFHSNYFNYFRWSCNEKYSDITSRLGVISGLVTK